MKFPALFILLSLSFFGALFGSQEEVIWSETFQGGIGSAKAYSETEMMEAVQEGGESFLRVTLPGKQPLEGVQFGMGPVVDGDRLMSVSAKVRGSGILGPMVKTAAGWTRLPAITLSDEWQGVRIPRSLNAGTTHPTIYFVSMATDPVPAGTIFEIADLKASFEPPLRLPDRDVKPRRFEMEDRAPDMTDIGEADEAICVLVRKSFATEEIPFPQTSQPVSIYVRYRSASSEDRLRINTRRGGHKQTIREMKPISEGWQWLEFSELGTEEVGDTFTIESWPQKGASPPAALDALVISTESSLDEGTLNSVR